MERDIDLCNVSTTWSKCLHLLPPVKPKTGFSWVSLLRCHWCHSLHWRRRRDSQNRNRREENEETNSHVRKIILNKQFRAKEFQFHMNLSIIDRLLFLLLAASAVQAGPRPQLRADLAYGTLSCKKKLMKKCKMNYIFRCRKRQRLL